MNQLAAIRLFLQRFAQIEESEWAHWSKSFLIKDYKKQEHLLFPNEVCKYIYFVNAGLLRLYFADADANEHTFHFSLENSFAADYESFLSNTPSSYGIQALENTQVVMMPLSMLREGYSFLKEGEKLGRRLAEDHFFMFSQKIKSIYTSTPKERYKQLELVFPGILKRVSQHYLASFLHITPVHLSRLKNT